jgi:nucleotide-binding universal stress UspA family protein
VPADASEDADHEIGKVGLSTIVVGVDGSEAAEHASAWAGGLARREGARLVLVYVEPIASASYWMATSMADLTDATAAFVDELRQEASRNFDATDLRWELEHHRGDPARVLEDVAEQRRADCIVVGRSRRGASLVGSVPTILVKEARRPVVVVP